MKKIFTSLQEKEMLRYMEISKEYFDEEKNQFLECQGSESFDKIEDIKEENFKYEGIKLENLDKKNFIVYVATIKDKLDDSIEKYNFYYLVVSL